MKKRVVTRGWGVVRTERKAEDASAFFICTDHYSLVTTPFFLPPTP